MAPGKGSQPVMVKGMWVGVEGAGAGCMGNGEGWHVSLSFLTRLAVVSHGELWQ